MASRLTDQIMRAAIAAFADYGYFGATTRDIAQKAGVTEPSIYRLFKSKENLFEEALLSTVNNSLDPARFLLIIYEHEQRQEKFSVVVLDAVGQWYASLPEQSARLLMYAALSRNERWSQTAYSRTQKIISLLADAIAREARKTRARKINALAAARTLILALFDFKITKSVLDSKEKEPAVLDQTVRQWLEGLSAS